MTKECRAIREQLIERAFGRAISGIEAHLRGCPECSKLLQEYRAMAAVGGFGLNDAPEAAIDRARALMQPAKEQFARLLRTTLGQVGARFTDPDAFQAIFEIGGEELRVMYSRIGEMWEVRGRVPVSSWTVTRAGRPVRLDADLGFIFSSHKLKNTGFEVDAGEGPLRIPSGQAMVAHDGSQLGD